MNESRRNKDEINREFQRHQRKLGISFVCRIKNYNAHIIRHK
jgi:hypothetical protein